MVAHPEAHTGRKRPRPSGERGLGLQQASKARLSTYDANHAHQQKRALKSKQVRPQSLPVGVYFLTAVAEH